jgi:DNA repair exonuclease SbcCD nuclease subunit
MKVICLGDLHLGARTASNHFSQFFNKFFSDVLYPYIDKNDIHHIIQLGDCFDNRTSLSVKAYHACKDTWFSPLSQLDVHMHILIGNHDSMLKSTIDVNTPELLLANEFKKNISVYSKPTRITIDNTTFDLIPWLCDGNREAIHKFMTAEKVGDICCGHFEIAGFEMMRGVPGHDGLPRDLFDRYERTFSGHYHTRSYDDYHRIEYVGTPYEITFADLHDPRGFTVFDTETRMTEFIPNSYTMFERIVYNDGWSGDVNTLKDKAVKLIAEKKNDLYEFDRFIDSVKLAGVYDLQIIENFAELHNVEVDGEIQLENSSSIINQYIDALTTSVDKERLKDYMSGLYIEATQ